MRIDFGAAKSLQAILQKDLAAIGKLEAEIVSLQKANLSEAEAVQLAYALHNVYGALENSFEQVTRTFENHIVNRERWHHELLEKMFLDLGTLRPAVLPNEVKPVLRDLLGFRHLFRHAYDYSLDTAKVIALSQQWLRSSDKIRVALQAFADQLGQIASE